MPTLKNVRTAIKSTLESAITGLKVYERVPAGVVVPAVLIVPALADYLVVHGNAGTGWEFDLVVLAPSADEDVAQDILDDYVDARGSKSIVAVICASPALGRSDCYATVRRMSNYGIRYTVGSDQFIGATLRLFVVATHA